MSFWNDPSSLLPKQAHRWVISFGNKDFSENATAGDNVINTFFAKSVERPSYQANLVTYYENYTYEIHDATRITWKPITIIFYDVQERNYRFTINKEVYEKQFTKTDETIYLESVPYFSGKDKFKSSVNSTNGVTRNSSQGLIKKKQSAGAINEVEAFRSTQTFFYNFLNELGYSSHHDLSGTRKRFRQGISKKQFKESILGASNYIEIKELSDASKTEFKEIWKLYNPIIDSVNFDKLDYGSEDILKITVTLRYDWAILESNAKQDEMTVTPEAVTNLEQKLTATIGKPKITVTKRPVIASPASAQESAISTLDLNLMLEGIDRADQIRDFDSSLRFDSRLPFPPPLASEADPNATSADQVARQVMDERIAAEERQREEATKGMTQRPEPVDRSTTTADDSTKKRVSELLKGARTTLNNILEKQDKQNKP